MKKLYVTLFCFFIISCSIFIYNKAYPINDNNIIMQNKLEQFINRPSKFTRNIVIKQVLNVDNKKYVVFSVDEILGYSILIRGLNGKYKIEFTGHGNDIFNYRIEKTNKSKYLFLFSKNYNMKVDHANIVIDGTI